MIIWLTTCCTWWTINWIGRFHYNQQWKAMNQLIFQEKCKNLCCDSTIYFTQIANLNTVGFIWLHCQINTFYRDFSILLLCSDKPYMQVWMYVISFYKRKPTQLNVIQRFPTTESSRHCTRWKHVCFFFNKLYIDRWYNSKIQPIQYVKTTITWI